MSVYPIDPTTPVGLFRTELGDVVASNINETDHTADYEAFTDIQLSTLMTSYAGDTDMAMSKALGAWANQLIAAAQDIQVDDIKIKTLEKAKLMSERAKELAGLAEYGSASTGFTVVSLTPTTRSRYGNSYITGASGF